MSLLLNCSEVAFKFLSSVEIDNYGSNQHELHGARAFKDIFGYSRTYLYGTIYYIATGGKITTYETSLTWYDAREFANNNRSEYRFYYTHEISVFSPKVDDILLLSQNVNQQVVIIIINDPIIKNEILRNINKFKSYDYVNGSSYYANLVSVPFLTKLF